MHLTKYYSFHIGFTKKKRELCFRLKFEKEDLLMKSRFFDLYSVVLFFLVVLYYLYIHTKHKRKKLTKI